MFRILKIKHYTKSKPTFNYIKKGLMYNPYYICHLDQYELEILLKALSKSSHAKLVSEAWERTHKCSSSAKKNS